MPPEQGRPRSRTSGRLAIARTPTLGSARAGGAPTTTLLDGQTLPVTALDVASKTLGSDRSSWVTGHGYLPAFPQGTIGGLWEHHAVVRLPDGVRGPRLGLVIAVVPNHVCTPVNLADELLVAQHGEVIDRRPVAARGANS
ncbi:hypothetical protein OG533_04980 [Streptomyces sp. NBC_01186]|uniref:hypothetical protein n=1 Tax=Streptomyces sp. NBC_01186 TaxID=2903765 RepID=UPI002E0F1422|nr:hypothetical protein OG533_04980 [Streptomyces sp. NBC_01186]